MKKDIKKIAESVQFIVGVERHGIYTDYILYKGSRKMRVERKTPKGKETYFAISSNFALNNPTKYSVFEGVLFDGCNYAIADNGNWAQLTIDEAISIIEAN